MTATKKIAISIQAARFDQLEGLRRRINLSRSRVVEMALEHFLEDGQNQPHRNEGAGSPDSGEKTTPPMGGEQRNINQGDVFWVRLEEANGVELEHIHPQVIIQDDVLNRSRIPGVVVCALTSNLKRAKAPGNVLLEEGEANLPKQSVVVVSQVSTVDKAQLGEYIGTLSGQRVKQILGGMRFVQWMAERQETPEVSEE